MRRTEREITDYKSMLEVLRRCDCCRRGFVAGDAAYIVPMNFGFEDKDGALTLYFHGATQGKKMSLLPAQRTVSFEADCGHALFEGQSACANTFRYRSVMGRGRLLLLQSPCEKEYGLARIMEHCTGKRTWHFDAAAVARTAVMRLEVSEWSCKENR